MKIVTDPLKTASHDSVETWCADGQLRRVHPILAAFEGDWPEQCDVCATLGSGCPMCHLKYKTQGNIWNMAIMRSKADTISALLSYEETQDPSILIDNTLRGYRPYWLDLPFTNLHTAITPDLLHQIYAGLYEDHLMKWAKKLVGETMLDRRFKSMPRAQGIRHFSDGLSGIRMWTGKESKEMAKVVLPTLIGTLDDKLVEAVRALLDFGYLAHMACMTEEDLADIEEALETFHRRKEVLVSEGIISPSGFNDIPKLHMLSHYAWSIRQLGTPDGYNTESPESLHTNFVKKPWQKTSKKEPLDQMTRMLERQEAIRIQKTHLTKLHGPETFSRKVLSIFIVTRVDKSGDSDTDGDEDSVDGDEDLWEDNDDDDLAGEPRPAGFGVVYPNPAISIAKRPNGCRLRGSQIIDKYGATDFIRSLKSALKSWFGADRVILQSLDDYDFLFDIWHRFHLFTVVSPLLLSRLASVT
jgi:hypothetical protein